MTTTVYSDEFIGTDFSKDKVIDLLDKWYEFVKARAENNKNYFPKKRETYYPFNLENPPKKASVELWAEYYLSGLNFHLMTKKGNFELNSEKKRNQIVFEWYSNLPEN